MSTTKPKAQPADEAVADIEWRTILAWFLRALAVLAIARGVMHWTVITGLTEVNATPFEDQPSAFQTITVALAIFDLVAGVGLWLGAIWGSAVWLMVVALLVSVDVVAQGAATPWALVLQRPLVATGADLALVLFYLVTSTKAARQSDQRSRGDR